jgi:hypothetical protein
LNIYIYIYMTTRNWRAKQNRSGCKMICNTIINNTSGYIPNTLTISTFDTIGTYTWVAPPYVTSIEYLVVGGGGGGGGAHDTGAAGGGGGGLALLGSTSVSPGTTYTIVVGNGGTGGQGNPGVPRETSGNAGESSSFDSLIALGGGGGYSSRVANGFPGLGGTAANGLIAPSGGNGAGNNVGGEDGGGGGGNTTAGGSSNTTPTVSRTAGTGLTSNISGSSLTYGAGGIGGIVNQSYNGANASQTTGNGGGGATTGVADNKSGGNGGSGIVILKYYI